MRDSRRAFALLVVGFVVLTLRAEGGKVTPQDILNQLAKPWAEGNGWTPLTRSFLVLSIEQRNALTRQVRGRCVSLYGLMNPNQSLRLLPEGQTVMEGTRLAVEVCALAHMPSDWPARLAVLSDARKSVARSSELGHL
jgi:hypothetical protein